MKTQRLIDMHVHTDNSPDGVHSPMFICEKAVDKNLGAVAFTDHCEIESFFTQKYDNMILNAYFECVKARSAFEGQLLVLIGLEIGQPFSDIHLADKVVSARPYDFILGSIHIPKGYNGLDIKNIPYSEIDVYKFMSDYFCELSEIANWKGCDSLAHITAPMRRIEGRLGINFDYDKIQTDTDKLLKEIILNKKCLEINTSGLRQPIGKIMPEEAIIRRYRELGGKLITIGSDAHTAMDVGEGLKEGISTVKRCGFDSITFFVNREPMMVEI